FGCEVAQPLLTPFCIAVLHDEVLALHIAELTQPLPEDLPQVGDQAGRARTEPPDPVHGRRLLRCGGERRHEDEESKRRDQPDGREPHGALLLSTLGPQKPPGWMAPALGQPNATRQARLEAAAADAGRPRGQPADTHLRPTRREPSL